MPRRTKPDPLASLIGRRIRALREAKGLRLEQVAFASGLTSKGHLSDVEHGRVNPTVGTLRSIASELGVELLDLVNVDAEAPRGALVERTRQLPEAVLSRWLVEADGELARARAATPKLTGRELDIVRADRAPRGMVPLLDLDGASRGAASGARAAAWRRAYVEAREAWRTVGWVRLDAKTRALPGVFVARVLGTSMEPRVPAGSYCVFRRPAPGNRRGRVFLFEAPRGEQPDAGPYVLRLIDTERVRGVPQVTLRSLTPSTPLRTFSGTKDAPPILAELVRVITPATA
jgi:transcriptional regulator with XRE-family HTH domain